MKPVVIRSIALVAVVVGVAGIIQAIPSNATDPGRSLRSCRLAIRWRSV